MHKTDAGERRKALKREASELAKDAKVVMRAAKSLPEASRKALELQSEADQALAESEDLKTQARLENLHLWQMEKVKSTKKGSKSYTYWMASWRESGNVHNIHLGSTKKLSRHAAMQKAQDIKAKALGLR